MANVQYNNGNKVKANIYDDSDLHSSVYNKAKKEYLFQWCILSGKNEIIIDDNSSSTEKRLKLKSIGQYPYEKPPKGIVIYFNFPFHDYLVLNCQ